MKPSIASLAAAASIAAVLAAPPARADGKALFQKNCAACHQASGKGIPGAFPALAGNPLVQGPAPEVATVLLQGRGGMPDFSASLSDDEIAAVLSFARSTWGNQAPPLKGEEVSTLRSRLGVPPYANGQMSNKH
ncbi:cytochrome c [Pseudoduganella sp. UC29_71]|jgi:mono/diheme cytochrome c family protein|uniref:c-type cytochrome n=1 Tax=Pseudoduganella sp. UC29_71 TaxID=3350174 RepID=UPI000D3136E3